AVAGAVTGYLAGVQERLLQSELASAAAAARAEEQRKRQRVRRLLWASVLTTLLLGGAAVGWWQVQRGGRNRKAAADLHEATEAMRAGRWGVAEAALQRDEGRLAGGGSERLRDAAAQARRELAMVERLDRILDRAWTVVENKVNQASAPPAYATAL